jgi:hypothetical protein
MVSAGPPAALIRRISSSPKKPMVRLSADQNGNERFIVSTRSRGVLVASTCTQSESRVPSVRDVTMVPSGEMVAGPG